MATVGLVIRGDRGPAVRELHHALLERGALPLDADSEVRSGLYGTATGAAVRSFQAASGLKPDGVVGPMTWAALRASAADETVTAEPDLKGCGTATARRTLEVATAELLSGAAEGPVANRGPRVDKYLIGVGGRDTSILCALRYSGRRLCPRCGQLAAPTEACAGPPWCGRFALWCVDEAARQLGLRSPFADWGDLASARKWRDAAARRSRLLDEPRPGRVGVIVLPQEKVGATPQGHLVIVAGVDGRQLRTVEGNSGNRVAARVRAVDEFTGFVEV